MLLVRTLGELRLMQAEPDTARRLRRKPLALLCYVARRAPRLVPRTELATLFWGERGEERARQSLRQALTELKQALGDRIDVDSDTVRLAADAVELDIVAFERDIATGHVDVATARWHGDFFEGGEDIGGEGFRRWIEEERAALHATLGMAMGKQVGDAELRGDWIDAVTRAERWTAMLPLDERAHLRLIEVYRMSGRHADALRTNTAFLARMRTVLDVDPSPEFLRLGGRLAEDARAELDRQGRGSAALRAPVLVGRAAVVRELGEAWARAASEPGVVVALRGDAGSGLTRICDELAERVRSDGSDSVVLHARGVDGSTGHASTFAMASALFDGLRNASGSAGASPEALAEVSYLVPALRTHFPHLPTATGDSALLRDALVQVLAAIGEEQPILLIVDDLHHADPESRQLLGSVAARLPRGVLLVLAEAEGEATSGEGVDDLFSTRGLIRLRLTELTISEVEMMVGAMLTLEPLERQTLATRLHEESGGLPHAIVAIVSALVDDQLLRPDHGGSWHLSPALSGRPLPLPTSIRSRVRARLDRLSPQARSLVEGLAVLTDATSAAVAGELAELSADEAELAIGELVAQRLVREAPAAPGQFVLPSPLLARAITAQTPPTRRQTLHARAARILEAGDMSVTAERSLLSYHVARAARPTESIATRDTTASGSVRRTRWTLGVIGGAVIALTALVVKLSGLGGAPHDNADGDTPIVALGRITDYRPQPGSDLTKPLSDMLATNLGRVPRLRVVSSARMYELVNQQSPGDTATTALVAAARHAGATELVEGALYARDDGGFRLDLRRVELASGNIKQTHSFAGRTLFELADSGTARLASDFGGSSPSGSIADVTTRSVAAYRLYEEGLRAFYGNDYPRAEPLFRSALKEDSTFAMAAYYMALCSPAPRKTLDGFSTAARLARRTSDRERLTILAHLAFLASAPNLIELADTLLIRYPDEVEGYYFKGLGLIVDGRFLEAIPTLNRVVAMDSLALRGQTPRCQACGALHQIVSAFQLADSLRAAEREARRWLRLQPQSPVAWNALADVLRGLGRFPEAFAALDQVAALDAGRREDVRLLVLANYRMYAGDFDQADRLYTGELESGSRNRATAAYWYRATSMRNQGRLAEALADARRQRALVIAGYPASVIRQRRALPQELFLEAQVLYEMQRYRASAAVFDSISRWVVGDEQASQNDHQYAWSATHAIGALIANGDTVGLAARIDSVELRGRRSGLKRDQLLHHHLRGLLHAARGRDDDAVAELRKAVFSWNYGYTRTNMALANAYVRLRRPMDAIAVLQPALRGDLEASNFYVTRTEVHEHLALAWSLVQGAAARDSASAHARYVAKAWTRADTAFSERRQRIAQTAVTTSTR